MSTALDNCAHWPPAFADRYREDGIWRGETLGELLRGWARAHGDRTALVHNDRRMSYTELDAQVDRTAAGFAAHGVGAGDRIVVQLPNVPEFVVVCFALLRLGAHPVFALASHRHNEIRHLCAVSDAAGYVVADVHRGFDFRELAAHVQQHVDTVRSVFVLGDPGPFTALADVDGDPVPPAGPDPSDVAFFLLSGGTTALPKLIGRTHDDYAYQLRACAELCELTADDTYLVALPVEFNFPWGCPGVLGTFHAGGTVVLADHPGADECFELVQRERVTVTSLVPSLLALWIDEAEFSRWDLSTLRLVQVGGAKLSTETARRVEPALGCRLQQVFGMAEGLLTMTRPDDPNEVVLTTQGSAISTADEIRIVDEDDVDVPLGQVGQLLARGPYTLRGYYRATEHNAKAFTSDGYYRTGDLARLTPTGELVIEGRIKDVIIRGGDKVSAAEVEEHLAEHPNVAQAAVVAMPDEAFGERVCAYVVPHGTPPTLVALKESLHAKGIALYKLPERLEVVDVLPLTGLGKVDKKALVADITAKLGGGQL